MAVLFPFVIIAICVLHFSFMLKVKDTNVDVFARASIQDSAFIRNKIGSVQDISLPLMSDGGFLRRGDVVTYEIDYCVFADRNVIIKAIIKKEDGQITLVKDLDILDSIRPGCRFENWFERMIN